MSFRGMAVVPIAIAIFIVAVGTKETHGFIPASMHPHTSHRQPSSRSDSTVTSSSALSALVYGTDGSVVGDDVFENPDDGVTRATDEEDNLLEELKISMDNPSVWNKIACAFAPPPHDRLTLELVRDASPVGYSDKSIDIALAVPASAEGGAATAAASQLVRVLVNVSFPQAWVFEKDASKDEKLSALLGQIKVLEGLAEDRMSQQRSSGGLSRNDSGFYEKQIIEKQWKEKLEEEPAAFGDGLPGWWATIAPPFAPLEVREEAKLLKKLLNEDEFEDELRALFVKHTKSYSPLVYRASVASVGSSGLFLKARVAATTAETTTSSDDDDDIKEEQILVTASIPYNNPPKDVKTANELREGVLLLVESVVPMPMPAITQASAHSTENEVETIKPFNEQVAEMVSDLESESAKTLDAEINDTKKETMPIAEVTTKLESGEDISLAEPEAKESETPTAAEDSLNSETAQGILSRHQPRPPEEEAKLAAKYAAIEDLSERAFAILVDLGMV